MVVTTLNVSPYADSERKWRTIFRGQLTGPQGLAFREGDIKTEPIFKMRRWYAPWSFVDVTFSRGIHPRKWKDGSLLFNDFAFKVPPLMWPRRTIYVHDDAIEWHPWICETN